MKNRFIFNQTGFSMIELLVALVILSVGLLGVAGLQIRGLQGGHSSYQRSQATLYAQDIIERMRANRGAATDTVAANNYDIALAANIPTVLPNVAKQDLNDWLRNIAGTNADGTVDPSRVRGGLPGGDGSVDYDTATQMVTVIVQWTDTYAGASTTANITMVTRL